MLLAASVCFSECRTKADWPHRARHSFRLHKKCFPFLSFPFCSWKWDARETDVYSVNTFMVGFSTRGGRYRAQATPQLALWLRVRSPPRAAESRRELGVSTPMSPGGTQPAWTGPDCPPESHLHVSLSLSPADLCTSVRPFSFSANKLLWLLWSAWQRARPLQPWGSPRTPPNTSEGAEWAPAG